jgi:hypothetical protein
MTLEEILEANGYDVEQLQEDKVLFFFGPDYKDALIGMTYDNLHAVYDYGLMVQSLVNHEKMTYEEAVEFIDYNSSFSMSGYNEPIVLNRFE